MTVAMGEGISDLFKSIGASVVIEGGQTMNPSTEDIVEAVKSVNAETVFILPNNSNIIMVANQAASVMVNRFCHSCQNGSARDVSPAGI